VVHVVVEVVLALEVLVEVALEVQVLLQVLVEVALAQEVALEVLLVEVVQLREEVAHQVLLQYQLYRLKHHLVLKPKHCTIMKRLMIKNCRYMLGILLMYFRKMIVVGGMVK